MLVDCLDQPSDVEVSLEFPFLTNAITWGIERTTLVVAKLSKLRKRCYLNCLDILDLDYQ